MIDPFGSQRVQRLPHVLGPRFLPGVGDPMQFLGSGEDATEEFCRVADFGGVQADADELPPVAQRGPQHG